MNQIVNLARTVAPATSLASTTRMRKHTKMNHDEIPVKDIRYGVEIRRNEELLFTEYFGIRLNQAHEWAMEYEQEHPDTKCKLILAVAENNQFVKIEGMYI